MATLTGAVSIALGDVNAAVLGTDQELIDEIIAAGQEVGEKFWQLPLDKEYSKQIKSDIADIKNVGGRKAGTITAAAFLKEFADGLSWAHLDIAGTAWGDDAKPYRSKGPTGIAVRTLLRLRGSRRHETLIERDCLSTGTARVYQLCRRFADKGTDAFCWDF